MILTLDDTTIARAILAEITRAGSPHRPDLGSPLGRAVADVVADNTDKLRGLVREALLDALAAPELRAQVDAVIRQALLEALADKVKSAVRTMPAAEARELAGALFPDRVRA